MGIGLSNNEYQFLKLGLSNNSNMHSGKLTSFMFSAKEGILFTTNGWLIYAIKTSANHQNGYYLWNESLKQLLHVDDKELDGKSLIEDAMKVRRQFLDQLLYHDPLPVLSFHLGSPGSGFERVLKPDKKGSSVAFRKGRWQNVMHSICLGVNFSIAQWNVNENNVSMMSVEDIIVFDLSLIYPIMKYMPNASMQWRDGKSPAIFGDIEGWHAIVMPMMVGKREMSTDERAAIGSK